MITQIQRINTKVWSFAKLTKQKYRKNLFYQKIILSALTFVCVEIRTSWFERCMEEGKGI